MSTRRTKRNIQKRRIIRLGEQNKKQIVQVKPQVGDTVQINIITKSKINVGTVNSVDGYYINVLIENRIVECYPNELTIVKTHDGRPIHRPALTKEKIKSAVEKVRNDRTG